MKFKIKMVNLEHLRKSFWFLARFGGSSIHETLDLLQISHILG